MNINSVDPANIDPVKVRHILDSGVMNLKSSHFQIHNYIDVGYKLFPFRRECSYSGLRLSRKSEFESAEEFLVVSVIKENFEPESNISFSWEQLASSSCSASELESYYSELHRDIAILPDFAELVSSRLLNTQSNCNWLFLEDNDNYYSIFWKYTERRLLKRCA